MVWVRSAAPVASEGIATRGECFLAAGIEDILIPSNEMKESDQADTSVMQEQAHRASAASYPLQTCRALALGWSVSPPTTPFLEGRHDRARIVVSSNRSGPAARSATFQASRFRKQARHQPQVIEIIRLTTIPADQGGQLAKVVHFLERC